MKTVWLDYFVRDRGGESAGKNLSREVLDFNWESFQRTPNAAEFVKKAYFAATKKVIRDLAEGNNRIQESDLQSYENLIACSLAVTKADLTAWCEGRDWSRAGFKIPLDQAIPRFKKILFEVWEHPSSHSSGNRKKYAESIAAIADNGHDSIADWLFVRCTKEEPESEFF